MPQAYNPELREAISHINPFFEVEFDIMDIDGIPLHTLGITNMREYLDGLLVKKAIHDPLKDLPLWAKIWPSSFVLGRFLRKFEPEGKTLLEIGAGMGVCSMIAARYGFSRIVCTDIEREALNFARANVIRNNLEDRIEVRGLDITHSGPDQRFPEPFDFIAASEILYLDELHKPLLKFIKKRLASNGRAFFCTDTARAKPRFQKLASREFAVREGKIGVKSADGNGAEQRRLYSIVILEKK